MRISSVKNGGYRMVKYNISGIDQDPWRYNQENPSGQVPLSFSNCCHPGGGLERIEEMRVDCEPSAVVEWARLRSLDENDSTVDCEMGDTGSGLGLGDCDGASEALRLAGTTGWNSETHFMTGFGTTHSPPEFLPTPCR